MGEMIKCKICGADIAKSAKTCPRCGAKNKSAPGAGVIAVSLLFTAFIIFLIFTLLPDTSPESGQDSSTPPVASKSADDHPRSPSANDAAGADPDSDSSVSSPVSGRVGFDGTITGDCFEISIVGAKWTDALETSLGTVVPDSEGTNLLCLIFSAKNTTEGTKNVANAGFNAYVDGEKILPKVVAGSVDDTMAFVGAVSSGMEITGFSVWELPEDWQEFQTSYIDAWTGGESMQYFVIHPDDIS